MLQLLTKYLFQYRTVSIPQVGTLRLIQHTAQLDIVDKTIAPPSFVIELKGAEEVTEHQLNFLGNVLNRTREDVLRDLKFFGDQLHEKINGPGFEWRGIGTFTRSTQMIPINVYAIQPVAAEKIIRADAAHQILVGDVEMTSKQMTERRIVSDVVKKKKSPFVLAGWILLFLSVLLMIFFLYTGKFKVNAAGSKQSPLGYLSALKTNL